MNLLLFHAYTIIIISPFCNTFLFEKKANDLIVNLELNAHVAHNIMEPILYRPRRGLSLSMPTTKCLANYKSSVHLNLLRHACV